MLTNCDDDGLFISGLRGRGIHLSFNPRKVSLGTLKMHPTKNDLPLEATATLCYLQYRGLPT